MKRNILLKERPDKQICDEASCLMCESCKVIRMEERRQEAKNDFLQLYAKEAEHYFFYYALCMAQK